MLESYLRRPEFDGPVPSLWMGEGGIALVAWLLAPAPALADRLAELASPRPTDDTLELMWGSPGLLLIADAMLERTGEERWAAAWSAIADRLMRRGASTSPDFWTQRLYGSSEEILGPAHGMAGVVAALARRPELLPHDAAPRRAAALAATAIRQGDLANWPPALERAARATATARSAPSGATARPAIVASTARRCPATTSSTRCCSRAAS